MKIREVIPKSPVDHTETEIILADLLKKDRSFLHAHPEHRLTENQTLQFINQVKRREKNEPLAYILGYKEFFGLRFLVDRHVMIPRHDTEELVESVLEYVKGKNKPQIKIVDIGTGSGCIAITLAKKLPKAKIYAVDVDQKSLVVARKNATRLKVYEKITFLKGALLSSLPGPVDVIVANLPYIKTGQIKKLEPEVHKWEPKLALDGGVDGMKVYKKLFQQANKYLTKDGKIFYEIDGKVFSKSANSLPDC